MRTELPEDPVQLCWFRQSRTEYSAAALTAQMSHWLIQMGVRPELLLRNTRVVGDEIRHSALCHQLYLHAGGEPRQVPTARSRLAHADDPDAPLELRAITAAGELACEESVALPVFKMRLRNATDPAAREVIEIILRDEATHRTFAWDLLDELIAMLGQPTVQRWARPRIAWWLRVYLRANLEEHVRTFSPAQLALGLIDRREHWALMKRTVDETIIPRFIDRAMLEAGTTGASLRAQLDAMDATS